MTVLIERYNNPKNDNMSDPGSQCRMLLSGVCRAGRKAVGQVLCAAQLLFPFFIFAPCTYELESLEEQPFGA